MDKAIFCIGGASIDHKLKTFTAIAPSSSNPCQSYQTFGGVAFNVAANLAQWTKQIHLQCLVGNDKDGERLLNHMQTIGVNTNSSIVYKNKNTSHYYAILNPDGELHVAVSDMPIYQDVSLDSLQTEWKTWPHKSIIFIDANMPKHIIEALQQYCLHTQSQLALDPVSVVKSANIPDDLTGVFFIKPNQMEASQLTQTTIFTLKDCFLAASHLLKRGVQHVVITLGERGYILVNDTEALHISSTSLKNIVDVNGAGDAFIAGILFGLQQSMSMKEACEVGAITSRMTLQSWQNAGEIPLKSLLNHITNKTAFSF